MSTDVDFKALWDKGGPKNIPDTKELFKKAENLRKAARTRLIVQTMVMLAAVAILLIVGLSASKGNLITAIGLWMMILAILIYVVSANQLLPMLFKRDLESSSREYLTQLIRIKRKYEFLEKVVVDIYFGLLFVGMLLYLLQLFTQLNLIRIVFVVTTFAFMGFCWFYAKTWETKRRIKPLKETIAKLEAVNEQLREDI